MELKPYKAVKYSESSIAKILDKNKWLIAETKIDGIRGLLVINNEDEPTFYTRTGHIIKCLEGVLTKDDLLPLVESRSLLYGSQGLVIDCELTVSGVDFYTGSGILRSHRLSKGNLEYHAGEPTDEQFKLKKERLCVHIFGVLPLLDMLDTESDIQVQGFMLQAHSQITAKSLLGLNTGIQFTVPESIEAYSMEDINHYYKDRLDKGYEGLILKDPSGIYRRGKKTGWFKMKPENEADGQVVGLVWGSVGSKYERQVVGFEVELEESGMVVSACNMSESLMKEVTANVKANGDSYYLGYQVQIKYMEKTNTGTLRHPSFDRFRGLEDNPQSKS
ncbi:ATP-dependent DNA ligase [Pasteurella phage vB_PmuP_Pa7]|uniref:DNA ligase n=1 Tax=Pasteurella phage vB_PmuP_Pa7 TaxID=2767198 RepID=A0A7G8ZYP2_9CAUD|nr:ATP-dependent DNA ligase [Pasteurella phage vB_PmuP_Pa7]